MYIYKTQVSLFQGIATLVAVALVLWAVGTHMFTQSVSAANLTNASDLLTDSEPSGTSVHTITFTMPNGMSIGDIFTVDFPAGFDLSSLTVGDISVTNGGTPESVGGSSGAGTWGVTIGGQYVQFETPTDGGVASSTELILTIGDEAANMITNPSATSSYEISVGTSGTSTIQDNGQMRVAIIENVLVTADINTTLTFTVNGTTTGAVCNGAPATYGPSTNTTLPFGTLSTGPGGRKTLCQDLTVATNAINGYVVTVEEDSDLDSSTGAVIDGFQDASYTDTPAAWASPSGNVLDDTTWGHWGLTSTDGTTTRAALDEFDSAEWVAASTSPRVVMGHDSVADGVTEGIGRASVGYSVEITALQEAGDDYNTTLTYIATPTF